MQTSTARDESKLLLFYWCQTFIILAIFYFVNFQQADETRRLGGTIFSVGVANFNLDQLTEIAGGSDQFVFQVLMNLFITHNNYKASIM